MHRTFSRFAKVVCAMLATTAVVMASDRIADEKIAVAKASIARAEQSGAPQSDPVDLDLRLRLPQTGRVPIRLLSLDGSCLTVT